MGVATLWVGALVMAIKDGGLPLIAGAPAFFTSPVWAVVPLGLVSISMVIFIATAILRSRTPQPPALPSPSPLLPAVLHNRPATAVVAKRPSEWGRKAAPWLIAILCIGAAVALVLAIRAGMRRADFEFANSPQMKLEPVLYGSTSLAQVRQIVRTQDPVAAEQALSKFLAQPMRAAGTIHATRSQQGGATYILDLTEPGSLPNVTLTFTAPKSTGISNYHTGDRIAAECKIERLDARAVGLDDCAAVDGQAWTGKAASPTS